MSLLSRILRQAARTDRVEPKHLVELEQAELHLEALAQGFAATNEFRRVSITGSLVVKRKDGDTYRPSAETAAAVARFAKQWLRDRNLTMHWSLDLCRHLQDYLAVDAPIVVPGERIVDDGTLAREATVAGASKKIIEERVRR